MKLKSLKVFILLLSLACLTARAAIAYAPQYADDARTVRLRWKNGVIPVAISTSLLKQNPNVKSDGDAVAIAIRNSLDAWEKAANVKFQTVESDRQSVSPAGKSGDGVSLITVAQTTENLLLFGGDGADEVSARTRTFFNAKGFITEADIVLNPYEQFSTDGSIGTFDLEATLTHEIGHLLGLGHSIVSGATMFERQGKNGTFGLPNFSARTLSEDDVAGARALYGAKISDADCCGSINGKLIAGGGKSIKEIQVWVEESETGRVAAAILTTADGDFRFDGLNAGKYSIYAQDGADKKKLSVAAQSFGAVEVGKNKTTNFTRRIRFAPKTFEVRRVGFNAQISELAIPLNGGKSFLIYVGGKNLDTDNFMVGFNSPFISFTPNTFNKLDYGSEMSVVSFEIKVAAQTPNGDYSLLLQSKNGETAYIVGGLTVETFINPWSVFALPADE